MAARFELGDPDHPRGHALLYFRNAADQDETLATYVVVLPIAINPAKYIPPAFAASVPQQVSAVSATALPPIPEVLPLAEVRRLAEFRGDDLLDGGVIGAEPERLMIATHETSQDYAARYEQAIAAEPAASEPAATEGTADEESIRWLLMSEMERVGELAKLTGQLRYAVDGADERLVRDTRGQIEKLARYLPEKYRIDEFLEAASRPGVTGGRLAALYVDRCYKLGSEQYEALSELDREIEALKSGGS